MEKLPLSSSKTNRSDLSPSKSSNFPSYMSNLVLLMESITQQLSSQNEPTTLGDQTKIIEYLRIELEALDSKMDSIFEYILKESTDLQGQFDQFTKALLGKGLG